MKNITFDQLLNYLYKDDLYIFCIIIFIIIITLILGIMKKNILYNIISFFIIVLLFIWINFRVYIIKQIHGKQKKNLL